LTAYKDILDNNQKEEKKALLSAGFDFSQLSLKNLRKINEATIVLEANDANPFYDSEGKWADPIGDYETSKALARIIKAKKK